MPEIDVLDEAVLTEIVTPDEEAGFGSLSTERGHLPLQAMDVTGRVTGLYYRTTLTQTFVNVFEEPLEATYIFPLEDRAGVTTFRLRVGDRVVEGELKERGQARQDYAEAIQQGHRAAIAEEERPGVFTMRAGNIPPGESVTVELEISGPLQVADSEATFRFPLVVAPRYIPGTPLQGGDVGTGVAHDTDAVPDASRITPPVLLKGQPNPVNLTMTFEVDPAGLPLSNLRASLHELELEELDGGLRRVSLRPGVERLDRDFVLRFSVAQDGVVSGLAVHADEDGDTGTFALTVVPPSLEAAGVRPRDVIVVLDRSGSMGGWKMVTARRAAGRLVDTLTHHDRFSLLLFDNRVDEFVPAGAPAGRLHAASDRNRFRAVEFLSGAEARGGTEMSPALNHATSLYDEESQDREKVLVFITDGQVGNEDQLLWQVRKQASGIRIFTIGIDRAVNAGFLRRLARPTGGVCELVESEDRLDEVMRSVYRRVGSPVVKGLGLEEGLEVTAESLTPDGECDVFPGVPAVLYGRYRGDVPETVTVAGELPDGSEYRVEVPVRATEDAVLSAAWARARVLDLEHRYVTSGERDRAMVDQITRLSLEFGVMCRFTAFVAVDRVEVVNQGGGGHKMTQPVEPADGWDMLEEDEIADLDAEGGEAATSFGYAPCELMDDISGAGFGGDLGGGDGMLMGGLGAAPPAPEPCPAPTAAPPPPASPAPAKPDAKPKPASDGRLRRSMASFSSMDEAVMDRRDGAKGGGGGLLDRIGDAVTGLAGKITGARKKKKREEKKERLQKISGSFAAMTSDFDAVAPSGLLARFAQEVKALLENAVKAIREATDAEAVRENLRYLVADLEDLLERAREQGLDSDEAFGALEEIVEGLAALDEADRAPGSEALGEWMTKLEETLDPSRAKPRDGGGPSPREGFWI